MLPQPSPSLKFTRDSIWDLLIALRWEDSFACIIFLKQYQIESVSLNSPGNLFLLFFRAIAKLTVCLKKRPNQQILTHMQINVNFSILATVHFEFGTLSGLQVP